MWKLDLCFIKQIHELFYTIFIQFLYIIFYLIKNLLTVLRILYVKFNEINDCDIVR